jgi:hypothetical protein
MCFRGKKIARLQESCFGLGLTASVLVACSCKPNLGLGLDLGLAGRVLQDHKTKTNL